MSGSVRFAAASSCNGNDRETDGPDPTPDPNTETTPIDEMNQSEDAEQGLVMRRRAKRGARMRVRRKT
jgi:hypothetical protein